MRKILKAAWIVVSGFIIIVYFLSCFTPFVSPQKISFFSLLAILFPYLFIIALLCSIAFFFINKRIAIALLLITLVAGFKNMHNSVALHSGRWQMQKNSNSLRIMSWNVEGFVNLFEQNDPLAETRVAMLKAIGRYKPDVLCIQELLNVDNSKKRVSLRKELDSLGFIYSFFSNDTIEAHAAKHGVVTITRGVALFSRLPFTDSARININAGYRPENMIYADINFNNRPVRIFTAHLRSFEIYTDTAKYDEDENIYQVTYKRKRSAQYKIRQVESAHAKEVAIIRNVIDKSPYPVIYCGDINSTPASYTYNALRGNLQDAFLEKGAGLGVTFYKLFYTLRIDVCLPDNKLDVLQCTVPQLYLSDHFPVVTDVGWR